MNNNYFYKLASVADRLSGMRKEAAPAPTASKTPFVNISGIPTDASNAPPKSPMAPSSGNTLAPASSSGSSPVIPGTKITPASSGDTNQSMSVDLDSMPRDDTRHTNPNRLTSSQDGGVGGMQLPTPTVDQLTDRWVQEKQDFYRNKATKYPQYANWTVNPRTREHLRQQAEEMIKNDPGKAREILATPRYNPETDVYRDEAFQYANRNNKAYVDERRDARAQEELAEKNTPMQNPTATSAIQNPSSYSYDDIRNGGLKAYYDNVVPHPGPGSSFYPQYRAGFDAFKSQFRPFIPKGIPDYQLMEQFWNYYNAALPGSIGGNDLSVVREMYDDPAAKQFIMKQDGSPLTIAEMAQEAGRRNASGYKPPSGLEPYWNYLLNIYNTYYNSSNSSIAQ